MRSLLVLLLALAGCLEPIEALDDPVLLSGTAETPPPVFAAIDCLQYHAYFATPSQPFTTFLPPGFRFQQTPAGAFELRIETTQCPNAAPTTGSTQLWIELPVIPPNEVAVPDHLHLLPIEVYVSTEELRGAFENASVRFVEGCHCQATNLASNPMLVDEIVVHSPAGVYELRSTMTPSTGAFRDEKLARYIADDGIVVAVLTQQTVDATNRGSGTVVFQYSGPGGAPPVHAGIIHSVSGTTITLTSLTHRLQQNV